MRKWTIYASDGLSDLGDMIFFEIHFIHEKKLRLTLKYHWFEAMTFKILDLKVHGCTKVDYVC